MKLEVKRLHPEAKLPTRAHEGDAGLDLYSVDGAMLDGEQPKIFGTGLAVRIPTGYVGLICDRSGLAAKHGVKVLGGVIDSGYRGEVRVILGCLDMDATVNVHWGDRIAQLLVLPIALPAPEWVEELDATDRGANGLGSTG